jgi:hypothetical protein
LTENSNFCVNVRRLSAIALGLRLRALSYQSIRGEEREEKEALQSAEEHQKESQQRSNAELRERTDLRRLSEKERKELCRVNGGAARSSWREKEKDLTVLRRPLAPLQLSEIVTGSEWAETILWA